MNYFKIRKRKFFSALSLTNWIILINVVLFFVFYFLSQGIKDFYLLVAVTPVNIFAGKAIWTIITSVFSHQLLLHLFVNMFSLYFLGNFTERIIGRRRLLWFYLIAGIVGSIFYVLFAKLGTLFYHGDYIFGSMMDPALGASGAIFGLLGLLAVLIPKNRVYLILGPLAVIVLEFVLYGFIPEAYLNAVSLIISVVLFLMIIAMFVPNQKIRRLAIPVAMPLWVAPIAAIVPLVLISFFVKLPIGNTAHLGGLIVGLIYGWYLRVRYKRKVLILQKYIKGR